MDKGRVDYVCSAQMPPKNEVIDDSTDPGGTLRPNYHLNPP